MHRVADGAMHQQKQLAQKSQLVTCPVWHIQAGQEASHALLQLITGQASPPVTHQRVSPAEAALSSGEHEMRRAGQAPR